MYSTSITQETMSRHDIIAWVNDIVSLNYTKVEQLCSGKRILLSIYLTFTHVECDFINHR